MSDKEFVKLCKKSVVDYVNGLHYTQITEDNVYIVWMVKVLQNNKALVSTTLEDGMYYEVTLNGDKDEAYVDCYKKWTQVVVVMG